MNREEAIKVAEAVACVDNYCESCASEAVERLKKSLPQFDWEMLVSEARDRYWNEDDEDQI